MEIVYTWEVHIKHRAEPDEMLIVLARHTLVRQTVSLYTRPRTCVASCTDPSTAGASQRGPRSSDLGGSRYTQVPTERGHTCAQRAHWRDGDTASHYSIASAAWRQTPSRTDMPHADHALTHAAPALPGAGSCLERGSRLGGTTPTMPHVRPPRQVSELCTFRSTPTHKLEEQRVSQQTHRRELYELTQRVH